MVKPQGEMSRTNKPQNDDSGGARRALLSTFTSSSLVRPGSWPSPRFPCVQSHSRREISCTDAEQIGAAIGASSAQRTLA